METKEVESRKDGAVLVDVPVVSKAVADASSDDIAQVITKRKHRFFDRGKKLEDHTIEELEILKAQKLEEERLAREKAADEATLAAMRQDKKSYYASYRQRFMMNAPYEDRLKAFFLWYTDHIRSPGGLSNKHAMEQIQSWMELFGVGTSDKRHVFTDREFESFVDRCKDAGIECPFDLFAKHAVEMVRTVSAADKHRRELYEKV